MESEDYYANRQIYLWEMRDTHPLSFQSFPVKTHVLHVWSPFSSICPVTRKSPSHACLLSLCSSDTTNSSLPAPRLIKASLLWLPPPLRLFWLAINGKNRCVGNEDSGRHANCVSLHPNIAAVQLHEPPPGDSDLHGQQRCDIIYDIYNILDPLVGIMK